MIQQRNAQKSNILWEPSEEQIAASNLKKFTEQNDLALFPYEKLHRWSVAEPEAFWSAVWDFTQIIGDKGDRVLVNTPDGNMKNARWFPDATLNFAENLLRGPENRIAVYTAGENGLSGALSMKCLREMVARAQTGLRQLGVKAGDRVAGVVTNEVETLIALLATASLGAIWTSCSPDFGSKGIIDRIGQVQPKVLFATLDYQYNGKSYNIRNNMEAVANKIDGLTAIVALSAQPNLSISSKKIVISWEELCQNESRIPSFTRVPFRHPLYILYTSGTTGLPKAIVHSVGGTLLQHVKEHQLHCDVRAGDVMSWYTSTAWMMYPWLISGLASGASILLYDGTPLPKDNIGVLFEVADQIGLTHFGISPKYLDTLQKRGYEVGKNHDLSKLRAVLSSGSPLSGEQYDWVYETIKQDMMLASISGGTEIIGCFVMGSPIHPVRRGAISCKALGMAVDVFNERGESVIHEKGDLVCKKPFPSMPVTFWGDGGEDRYHSTYFAKRPGIWTHGDFAEQTIEQTLIIYGRSDTTLNPGGVRIGTAEIYRIVEQFDEIADSIVFGIPNDKDEMIVMGVVVNDGHLSQALVKEIRSEIRTKASPRHVPRRIYEVTAIPYTFNGKKVEGAARSAVLGKKIKNRDSLQNPQCLNAFASLLDRSFQ